MRTFHVDAGLLVQDLVIREDSCNLACTYCLTGQSLFKTAHAEQGIFKPPIISDVRLGSSLRNAIREIDAIARASLRPPLLKITGGEVLLLKGHLDLITELSSHYATTVVQTNAVLLSNEAVQRFSDLGRVVLQISLDATNYEGNSHRVTTRSVHERILNNIRRALDANIPVEIYAVIHDKSAAHLPEMLDYFMPWEGLVEVFPFPIRGPSREKWYPDDAALQALLQYLENPAETARILPPRPYLDRLADFLRRGERVQRCHLPRLAFTTFDDGILTPCPNIWFEQTSNLREARNPEEITEVVGNRTIYRLLLAPHPRIEACKRCFTPWETLTLYLEKLISLEELARSPVYRAKAVQERLQYISAEVDKNRARVDAPLGE